MAARYFNWKLAIVLVVGAAVFAIVVFSLHRWQRNARAGEALPLGEKAFEEKRWDDAAVELGRYIQVNGQDVPALLKYAKAQLNRRPRTANHVQQAVQVYRTVLLLKPDDMDTATDLAGLYLAMGKFGEVELIAQRHLERQNDPGLRRVYAEALRQQRKFNEAAAELKKIIQQYPGEINAFAALGAMAMVPAHLEVVGKPAEFWFDEAVAKNPDSALAYTARAAFYRARADTDRAMADMTRALGCDLSETDVRLAVIAELINVGELEQARAQLQALEKVDATEPRLWGLWADLAQKARSEEEMYTVAETGMTALGADIWDFIPLATRLLIESDHLEKVPDYLSQMRNKDLDPIMTAFLEGLLAQKQNRQREAVAAWQRAISLLPPLSRQTDWQTQIYVHLALALRQLDETQSAIGQLQILLAKHPNYLFGNRLLAELFARTMDWRKTLNQAIRVQQLARNQNEPNDVTSGALLELQARTSLLANSADADTKSAEWRDIEARLAQLDKQTKGDLMVKRLQIQVATAQKKFDEAAVVLSELEARFPSDLSLMLMRARLQEAQGKETEAMACLQKAMAEFPQAVEPVRELAVFLDRRNRKEECETLLKEAFSKVREPQTRRSLGLVLAQFYSRWQEKDKVYQWLTDLAAQDPNSIRARRWLLTCDPVMNDADRSQRIVEEIKSIEGEQGLEWRYEQARFWARTMDFGALGDPKDPNNEEATSTYGRVVKLLQENLLTNAEDQASRVLLAGVYGQAGESQLALSTYREAYDRNPSDIQVLVPYVTALHQAQDYRTAQQILDKVDDQTRQHPALLRLLVETDISRSDFTSASDTLELLIEQEPNDVMLQLRYARILALRNEFARAEAILVDLRAKFPDSVVVARTQIRLQIQQGNRDKAMQLCHELVDRLHSASTYMLRAETYIMFKEYGKALEDLGQAIALEPERSDTWEARARVYYALERVTDAIPDIRRALALAPEELRVQKLAIVMFVTSGSPSLMREAEGMLKQALAGMADRQGKGDAELNLMQARILASQGTGPAIEEARRILRQITVDFPRYAPAWESMARLELDQSEPSRALDIATRGLAHNERNKSLLVLKAVAEKTLSPSVAALTTLPALFKEYPDDAGILIEWADAHVRAGQPEQAVRTLNEKMGSFSGRPRRHCEIALAAALYSDAKRDEAKALFETLIVADPNDPTPVVTLAHLLRKERRWTEVNQLVHLWRTTNPRDAETSTSMARILAGSGDREALQMAEDQLRMILDPNPNSVSALLLLSMLMQDAGRDEEANRLNRRIIDLDPNNVIAINNLAWALCERPNPSQETLKEALDLAGRGLTLKPDYVDLLDTRGVVYHRCGELEKAVADLLRCIELFPEKSTSLSAAPRFHLARVYADMRHRAQAVEQLREALTLNRRNIPLAKDHAGEGRRTHAIKVLKDAVRLQEEMDQFKGSLDLQDPMADRYAGEWTDARLLLEQLQKGLK